MAKQPKINVSVSVADSHELGKVASALKTRGFVLKESLDSIRVLTGNAPASAVADLSKVAGVTAVEEERTDYHTQQ